MNQFVSLITAQARKYGDREQLRYKDYDTQQWTSMSWNELKNHIDRCACALCRAGVQEQGKVAVFTQNCPEILITHFGAFYNRAVPVPIYATSSKDEAAYIINDSGATVVMAGDQRQYDISRELHDMCPQLRHVVVLDPRVELDNHDKFAMRWAELKQRGDDKEQCKRASRDAAV